MELRKDYLLDRFVIISPKRAERPKEFEKVEREISDKAKCPFCPENEHLVPQVLDEVKEKGKWIIRSITNKFAAVSLEGDPAVRTDNEFFTFASAYGYHEVLIETRDHGVELEELPEEHIAKVIEMYIKRIKALNDKEHIKYVAVFKNRGMEAGASITHSHSQIIAFNEVPSAVREKLKAYHEYYIKNETCPYCRIMNIEKGSYRSVLESEHFIAFTPYASQFHYELWIFPKRHVSMITLLNNDEVKDLASVLKQVLTKLDKLDYPAFNMEICNSGVPEEDFHFHIEIMPRMAIWAGFEFETGVTINSIPPEDAAAFYKEK